MKFDRFSITIEISLITNELLPYGLNLSDTDI